jgi:copper(I)-binding protein
VEVVPGKATELKPGGYHVMLIEIVKPLGKGDKVPLTLEFRGANGKTWKQRAEADVRDLTGH